MSEQKKVSDLKYNTKKRLEKLKNGSFKIKPNFTEKDLLDIIADCDTKLNTQGSRGRSKFTFQNYPKIEEYLKWDKQICI